MTTAIPTDRYPRVAGHCPMGCGRTLFLGAGGYVTCSFIECPAPCAAGELLDTPETEHIVKLEGRSYAVKHPLKERISDPDLFDCPLFGYLHNLDGPPRQPGRYRVQPHGKSWAFTPLEEATA